MPTSVDNLAYLRGLFPQKSLEYLKTVASYYKNDAASLATFVRGAVESNYFPPLPNQPDEDLENFLRQQLQTLRELLPDAEDEYLQVLFDENAGSNNMEVVALEAVISKSYPQKRVTKIDKVDFDVKLYCELIPDPVGSYSHPNYIMTDKMKAEATDYLVKVFGEDRRAGISSHVDKQGSLYLAYKKIREAGGEADGQLFSSESFKTVQPKTFDKADYFQVFEKLLIENEGVILSYLEKKRVDEEQLFKQEEAAQSLKECMICLKDSVSSAKMLRICDDGHTMCDTCVKEYTVFLYSQSTLFFPCTYDCKLFISNAVIRSVWDSCRYSKLLEDRINAETKDVVPCPFCNYGNEDTKNQEILCTHCLKKFCVLCKKIAHLPAECHKMENDLCKVVEEAMTGALVRKCPKCGVQFVKEAGYCNSICCTKCSTLSCYLCRKIVTGYDHFYGQGVMPSEAPGKCPLYADINHLHVYNVISSGKKALEKVKNENPNVELLYNPLDKPPVAGKSDAVPNQF